MKTTARKRGRPRIHENPVWIGIKTSQKKRDMIKKFAKEQGKPASQVILEIVTEAIREQPKLPKKMTVRELLKLSNEERSDRLRIQTEHAANLYKSGGKLDFSDNQDYIEYS
jgi:hypothetical protein